MKKLFSALLCLILIISAVSCTNTSNTNNSDSNNTQNNQNDENGDPYKAIIEKYTELLICKKNNTAIPEATETDSSALKTVYELAKNVKIRWIWDMQKRILTKTE